MADKPRFQRVRKIFTRGKNYGRDVVNADQIESEWKSIKDMAGAVLKPKKGEGREETFDNAMSRLGLGEDDLKSAYKFHVVRVYIFLVGLAVGLGLSIMGVYDGSWMAAAASLGFTAAMAALSFQASFRSFQIRRRELIDISFWFDNPQEWVPKSINLPPQARSKSTLPAKRPSSSKRSGK